MLKYWLIIKSIGKTRFDTLKNCWSKRLINTVSYSNLEIWQTLENSESSVRQIRKKINLGEELYPQNWISVVENLFSHKARMLFEENLSWKSLHYNQIDQIKPEKQRYPGPVEGCAEDKVGASIKRRVPKW